MLKPLTEVAGDFLRLPIYIGRQLLGGAWGDLGERYGPAMGGHDRHPASITILSTPEVPGPDSPDAGSAAQAA